MLVAGLVALTFLALDSESQELLDAHQSALGLIRTLQVEFKNERVEPDDQGKPLVESTRWIRSGTSERAWGLAPYLGSDPDGRPLDRQEWAVVGNEYRLLSNYDWNSPQPTRPTFQGTVDAERGLRSSRNPTGANPARQLLMELHFSPRLTLWEAAAVATKVESLGTRNVAGRSCQGVLLETRADLERRIVEVWLDPGANWMIARIVERRPDFKHPDGRVGLMSVGTVSEFRDYGNGVFIPQSVHFTGGSTDVQPDSLPVQWQMTVTSCRVNEPIPDSEFELKFPKYSVVRDMSTLRNGRVEFELWGDHGPLKRMRSSDELMAFEAELMRDPQLKSQFEAVTHFVGTPPQRSTFAWWPYLLALLIVAALSVPLVRRFFRPV